MAKLKGVNSFEAEAKGFLIGLQQIWICGLNPTQQNVELGNLIFDLQYWMSFLPMCSVDYVNRERNSAADMLQKNVLLVLILQLL
ncbi:hypothetical protein N665_0149s0036 [Sinapis alba]|nr:hypothetical protein N665_0149s0036 [Sinapis alba]